MRTACNYASQLPLFQSCHAPNDSSNMPQFLHIGLNSSQVLSTQCPLLWMSSSAVKCFKWPQSLMFWNDILFHEFWLGHLLTWCFFEDIYPAGKKNPRFRQGHFVESHISQQTICFLYTHGVWTIKFINVMISNTIFLSLECESKL